MKEIKTMGKNYNVPELVRDLDKDQIRHLISETDNTQFIPPKSFYRHFVLWVGKIPAEPNLLRFIDPIG